MATIRGFSRGTVILFATPASSSVFTDSQPPTVAENNQPPSEAAATFPQVCGVIAEYLGPLTPDMGEML